MYECGWRRNFPAALVLTTESIPELEGPLLRKYLIAAVAALTALAFTAVAIAQTPAASMSVKVAPKKAGTAKKPKNSSIELNIKNNDPKKTLSKLVITS